MSIKRWLQWQGGRREVGRPVVARPLRPGNAAARPGKGSGSLAGNVELLVRWRLSGKRVELAAAVADCLDEVSEV